MLPQTPEDYPHLRGVRQLVRQSALSHTDWLNLIEARRALIEPHLRSMELGPIGKVQVMKFSPECACLVGQGSPEVIASRPELSLDTRCYYPTRGGFYAGDIIHTTEFEFSPPGSSGAVGGDERFWALTRAGAWLMITATVQFPANRLTPPHGYPIERARAAKVVIRESSVPEIISQAKTTPHDIWQQLGKLAQEWYDRRKELLRDAKRLSEIFELEDKMLAYIRK